MAYIYKITNLVNGKVYIGETVRTISARWKQHVSRGKDLNYTNHLYRAMRKYGIENFKVEEVEECLDTERFERESYYILFFKSYEPFGYNYRIITQEGKAEKTPYSDVELAERIYSRWLKGEPLYVLSEEFHLDQKALRIILKRYGATEEDFLEHKKETCKLSGKKINQYDLQGNLIATYKSAAEAGRVLGVRSSSISKACSGYVLTAFGYIWQYAEVDEVELIVEKTKEVTKTGKNKKEIAQYSLDGELIAIYESGSAAARAFNTAPSGISYAARKGGIAYGYRWKYTKEEGVNK